MKFFVALALAVTLSPVALAQHETFAVNPDASEVKMKLNTTHEVVNGTFRVQSGSIDFDRSAPKASYPQHKAVHRRLPLLLRSTFRVISG